MNSINMSSRINTGISNQADVFNLEQHRQTTDLPASTYAMIRATADRQPHSPALSFFLRTDEHRQPATWSYKQLLGKIHQTANFFHTLGASKNSVIAYVLPNLPETHCVIWGGQTTGIVAAINPLLEPAAIAELLNAAEATILVTLAPFPNVDLWPKLQQVLPLLTTVQDMVLVNLANHVVGHKKTAAHLLQKREEIRLHGVLGLAFDMPKHIRVHDFNRSIKRQPSSHLLSPRQIQLDDISSYFCTGGTTGLPKLAMRRQRNEVANVWSAAQFLGDGVGTGKNIFCGLPLFHVNGVLVTGLLPFYKGAHVILGTPQGYRGDGVVKRFWEIVEHHHINFFSGVPTLYSALLQVPIGDHKIDSLEYGLCGAAPLPVEVFRNFQDRTRLKILEGYGLTEGTCVSSVNPPLGERRLGSIGLRIPYQLMKSVQLDEQGHYLRDSELNQTGVLVISGPNVFAGYKLPEQNKGLWINTGDGKRWLNTGDLGHQDEEGYFWLTGRKKELIIRGGHNIDPAVIEEPLHRHPAVQIAAAVGRPDCHSGELPVAYVQLKEGHHVTEAELMAFAKREITERAALPKHIRMIEHMPLTAVGKIFKPDLKKREIIDALTTALSEANVPVLDLTLSDEQGRGLVVTVLLATQDAKAQTQRLLGQFPFPFMIQVME